MLAVMKSEIFNYCFRVRESESKVCPSIYAFFFKERSAIETENEPETNSHIEQPENLSPSQGRKKKKREIKDEKRNTLNCFLS